jgi:multidrug resistance efflux pump
MPVGVASQLVAAKCVHGGERGGNVSRDDLLFEIDPRTRRYALRLAEAQADLGRDLGQSKSAGAATWW